MISNCLCSNVCQPKPMKTKCDIPYVAPMCSTAYDKDTPDRARSLLIHPPGQVGLSGQCYNIASFSFKNSKPHPYTLTTQALPCHSLLSTLFDGEGSSTISQRTKSVSISLGRSRLSYSGPIRRVRYQIQVTLFLHRRIPVNPRGIGTLGHPPTFLNMSPLHRTHDLD